MGYSPRGRKESDRTERLHYHLPREAIMSPPSSGTGPVKALSERPSSHFTPRTAA